MISMDVKGVTWVGGVYQKFETMCLEVEEDMYQDTVKFVENQVQTVGASVKKFYADVMQDLVCHSRVDSEIMPAFGYPVENNFHVDNSKKSKVSKKGEPVKVDVEKLSGDSEVIAAMNMDMDHKSLFRGQHMDGYRMLSSGNCGGGACSDVYLRQDYDGSNFNNSNSVVKENPIKENFPGAITLVESDLGRPSSSCCVNLNDTHEVSSKCRDTAITPSITKGMTCKSTRESCVITNASRCTADVSVDSRTSNMIVLDKLEAKEWNEIPDSSFGGSSVESNGSSPSGQVHSEKYAAEEISASHPGGLHDSNFHATESNTVVHGTETIQQSEGAKLEETCVMVTGEDVHFVPHVDSKHRPDKNAFALRKRSARKQEYEQIALWYGDDEKSNLESGERLWHSPTVEETQKSPAHEFCESEWEIL
ncbi:uncharacterized protein LOC103945431 isoform X2 [Pyrus x bretschneideri]|uniref:uncharacterized protein LOC103945431 isoform X2 n=1 Tax=Pyrus x bretschneideri TaxID=225117 RepID=UPI0020302B4D|nr:uncharacterized protein LOC103945431 isoform X2 [Pyrus x bretschneideri]